MTSLRMTEQGALGTLIGLSRNTIRTFSLPGVEKPIMCVLMIKG